MVPPTRRLIQHAATHVTASIEQFSETPVYRATVILWVWSKESFMDKDRVKGIGKQVAGSVKEAAGKVTGDAKLKTEGKAEKAVGKVQNAVGGVKDAVRGKK